MHVLFLTESGGGAGWGHVSRCTAIAQAFEEKGHSTQFVIDGSMGSEFAKVQFPFTFCKWVQGQETAMKLLHRADAVIVDSYKANAAIYAGIASRVPLVACLDDTNRLEYPAGIVINSSVSNEMILKGTDEKIEYLLGPTYAPLRMPFWDTKEKRIRQSPRMVLIYLSENDPRKLCGLVIDSVLKIFGGGRIICIASGNAHLGARVLNGVTAEKIKSLMMKADLAVAAGGQIIFELARVGVPTVAIGIAENQKANIDGWQKRGFIEFAGWWNNEDLSSRLERSISVLRGIVEREDRARLGKSIIDGQGARRIRDRMLTWR
jgi:spore coat polysaccharide biosynthesis predicted glycosyltransferase SpsG